MSPIAADLSRSLVFGEYQARSGFFDEYLTPDHEPRPAVRPFLSNVEPLGQAELQRRWLQSDRVILENDVTHNVHGDTAGRLRPWRLDGLPLLLDSGEWNDLAAGLQQRALLLDLILKDLYGPQNLLRRGLLPPELIFGQPGFYRPLHGQRPAGGLYLHLYAADLARSPDGCWWVVSDRTEDPGGAGYALENRIALSRALPEAFHDCKVRRLASYFIALREHLKRLVAHRENPFIVLLSSGPGASNFFEDVYLSRYLGFTLVQGGDLGVRDDKVVLKTLGGLTPVDAIVRRVATSLCDPLELDGSSTAGVPGLLQAVRKGSVVIANALGSGLTQAPAFMAFLGPLCRALFGEDLKIPSVATWWCGSSDERKYVCDHLDSLVIRDAFRRRSRDPIRPWLLSANERERLVASIRSRPHEFVGQEIVQRSCAPVWVGGRCEPWSVALRTFLVASENGYDVMPGGLARVARAAEALDVTVSAGEGSKDTWVLSDEPVRPVSLLRQKSDRIELKRSGSELPSRVADNLYWLGRHVARADGTARLLRTLLNRLANESEATDVPERPLLLRCAAAIGQIKANHLSESSTPIESSLPEMIFDESRRTSLRSQLVTLYNTAWTVRDRLSFDAWRIISRLAEEFPESDGGPIGIGDLLPQLNRTVLDLAAFSGLVADSMTRSQGWRFLDIGRRLEHALHLSRLLSAATPDLSRDESSVLESLLEAADSLMTYRSRYLANLQAAAVLDLLLTDDTNPRSIAFQVQTIARHIDDLPHDERQAGLRTEQRQALSLLYAVRSLDILALGDDPGRDGELGGLLQQLAYGLPELSDAVTHRYLHHSGISQQFADLRPGA